MKLGMHTYSLYHHGVAEDWAGFELPWGRKMTLFEIMDFASDIGLEGLHLDAKALDIMDEKYYSQVKRYAAKKDFYLEYNFSLKNNSHDSCIQHGIEEGILIANSLGADIAKISMNIERPRPVASSKFHSAVMQQLESVIDRINKALLIVEKTGVKLALENHTDTFSEEIIWLLDKINHPMVGACIDTVNALHLTENPITAVENLAPRAFTNHFRDNEIIFEPWGIQIKGAAVGEGDLDMKKNFDLIRQNPNVQRINIELDLKCPLDNMDQTLEMERSAIERSVAYCRNVLCI